VQLKLAAVGVRELAKRLLVAGMGTSEEPFGQQRTPV
jgi:hypothetical protein